MNAIESLSESRDSVTPGRYVLATGAGASHRLKVLHEVYGPGTRGLLERAGVRRGLRVADFGCGTGMVSRLLSEMVGPGGEVVGLDFSAEQIEQARQQSSEPRFANTRFLQGDATDSGLAHATFDVVYCRFLLLHLARPVAALREMTALLKPGGVLVCEDGDLTVAGSVPRTALNMFADLSAQLAPVRGVDYAISRRLYHLFLDQGFSTPNVFIHQPAIASGEGKSLLHLSVEEAGPALIEAGILSETALASAVAQMRRAHDDPSVLALMPPMTQVWATKDTASKLIPADQMR